MRRRQLKKQKQILIIGSLSLLLFLCVGYAAFGTQLSLKAKGNVKDKPYSTPEDLKDLVINDGSDGLYEDEYEPGRYIYRGANPDNYLTFNNETAGWRIVAIENDNTVKIVKDDDIGQIRFSATMNYALDYICTSDRATYEQCNFWSSNMVNGNSIAFNGTSYTVHHSAYLNMYLNSDYYNTLTLNKDKIIDHDFYVGGVADRSNPTMEEQLEQEKAYVWHGKIAIISSSDYLKSQLDEEVCGNFDSYGNGNVSNCPMQSYLSYSQGRMHTFYTITPSAGSIGLWSPTYVRYNFWYNFYVDGTPIDVYPTMYLTNELKLTGSGTENDPYQIIN